MQSDGTHAVQDLNIGESAGASGTYTLSGGSLTVNNDEYVGDSGVGTVQHSAGTNTVGGNLWLGIGGAGSSYSLSGTGSLTVAGTENIRAAFTQSGGMNTASLGLCLGSA